MPKRKNTESRSDAAVRRHADAGNTSVKPVEPEPEPTESDETEVDLDPNRGETESYAEYSARLAAILKTTKKLARQENKGTVLSETTAVYGEIIQTHSEQIAAEILALDSDKRIRALSIQIAHVGDTTDVEVRIKSIRVAKPKPRNK